MTRSRRDLGERTGKEGRHRGITGIDLKAAKELAGMVVADPTQTWQLDVGAMPARDVSSLVSLAHRACDGPCHGIVHRPMRPIS